MGSHRQHRGEESAGGRFLASSGRWAPGGVVAQQQGLITSIPMEAGELRAFQQVEIDLQAFASSCCGMPSGNTKSVPQVAGDRSGNRD